MAGIALQKPRSQAPSRTTRQHHPFFWALFSMALVLLIGMAGLPLVNTYLAAPSDLNGQYTCMASCPKATSFTLRGGGVYREAEGRVEHIGYWKWNARTGLVLKSTSGSQKPFRWLFFQNAVQPEVHFRWWTGAPQFCVDRQERWCYVRTREL